MLGPILIRISEVLKFTEGEVREGGSPLSTKAGAPWPQDQVLQTQYSRHHRIPRETSVGVLLEVGTRKRCRQARR